jgi:adenine deaminase
MQMGADGFAAIADDLRDLSLLYLWMVRLSSQSRFPGEEEMFAPERVEPLLRHDDVLGSVPLFDLRLSAGLAPHAPWA